LGARPAGWAPSATIYPKKAGVLVIVHDGHELVDGGDFGCRVVAVPLQVRAHPEDPPDAPRADDGGLCERAFPLDLRPIRLQTNLEQFHTLSRDSVAEIEPGPELDPFADRDDWRDRTDEERRIYCVGMTRAEETRTLCEANERPNPFPAALAAAAGWCRSAPGTPTVVEPQLRRRFLTLGLRDVVLSIAGRCSPVDPIHERLERLSYGDPLAIVAENGGKAIETADGATGGRSSQRCELPQGQVIQASVGSVVYRARAMTTDPRYLATLRVGDWWVVLPLIVVAP
jgi:hypothetical protein